MTQDVGTFIRRIQAVFPPGSRGPAQMRALYEATRGEWAAVQDAYATNRFSGAWAGREVWKRDAQAFDARMADYEAKISAAQEKGDVDEKAFQASIAGFFIGRHPSGPHATPDFATPRSLSNRLEEIGVASQANTFSAALIESSEQLPQTLGRAVGQTADIAGHGAGLFAGSFLSSAGFWGLAAVVGTLWAFYRTRKATTP